MGTTPIQENTADLRSHLQLLWRRRWLILVVAWLVPLAAITMTLRQQDQFEATSDVLLKRGSLAAGLNLYDDRAATDDPARDAKTQASIGRTPAVAARALRIAKVREITPQQLLEHSSVTPAKDADLLTFTVRDGDGPRAQRLATAYAGAYTQARLQLDSAAYTKALSDTEARIRQLEASGDRRSELYKSLVETAQRIGVLRTVQTASATVVRPAVTPSQIAPKPVRNAVLALVLGLALGVGLALLREALDTRVRSGDEIGEQLGLPLLARIPTPSRDARSRNELVMLSSPSSGSAEAYRVLRTNIELMNLERRAQVIMVTSAIEGEGKSTTAANLALSLARADRRVALVDLDLRRPALARYLRLPPGPGLTDVALGDADLDGALFSVPVPPGETSLDVLRSGSLHPHPGEFIGTPALGFILEDLRSQYDLVVIDAPPILRVGDGLAMTTRVDAVVVVTRLSVIRRPMLGDLRRALDSSPADAIGVVITGADADSEYGYGRYGYEAAGRQAERIA